MKPLIFVTGNDFKFKTAQTLCNKAGLQLTRLSMDIPEIQAESGEVVARDKALRVYEELKQPLIISDDSWMIPALKDFPGPYMKSVNRAFTAEDWLRLTSTLTDRRIILRQIIVFQNADKQRLFYTDIEGVLLSEVRGTAPYPHMLITSFDGGKASIAEATTSHGSAIAASGQRSSWHDFCEWYAAQPIQS